MNKLFKCFSAIVSIANASHYDDPKVDIIFESEDSQDSSEINRLGSFKTTIPVPDFSFNSEPKEPCWRPGCPVKVSNKHLCTQLEEKAKKEPEKYKIKYSTSAKTLTLWTFR